MFSEHISGLARSGAARRSSRLMPWPPPVVMLITAPVDCLIRGRNCMKTPGSGVGRPSFGSRAWRCRIAAPASAAAIASLAISSGVRGKCGLIVGVWIDPVTAQVMTTLPPTGMAFLPHAPMPTTTRAFGFGALPRAPSRGLPRQGRRRLARRSDERFDPGVGLGLPSAAVEDAIMADFELKVVGLFCRRDAGAQLVRGNSLADTANVVSFALDS